MVSLFGRGFDSLQLHPAGTETLNGGSYEVEYYISTTTVPSIDINLSSKHSGTFAIKP